MTTTQMVLTALFGTFWLVLIIGAVIACVWLTRNSPTASRPKQQYGKQKSSNAENAVAQQLFGSGLVIRVWKNAVPGAVKAGITLLKRTDRGLRQTLSIEHCLDVPRSLLFLCDELDRQSWLLDEDRTHLPRLRAAMRAADAVIRQRDTSHINGHTVDVDVTSDL